MTNKQQLAEMQFGLAYKGIVDAAAVNDMDISRVYFLDRRLTKQVKDENEAKRKAIEKARNEAAARRNRIKRLRNIRRA